LQILNISAANLPPVEGEDEEQRSKLSRDCVEAFSRSFLVKRGESLEKLAEWKKSLSCCVKEKVEEEQDSLTKVRLFLQSMKDKSENYNQVLMEPLIMEIFQSLDPTAKRKIMHQLIDAFP